MVRLGQAWGRALGCSDVYVSGVVGVAMIGWDAGAVVIHPQATATMTWLEGATHFGFVRKSFGQHQPSDVILSEKDR